MRLEATWPYQFRALGLFLVTVCLVGVWSSSALAQESRKLVGITPLVSKVADIPADAATDLFINTLMETNRFAIKPPDANGSFMGAEYVLETTISEAKAKTNVLGFLKDVATSKPPVNLTIRVFDPRSNALVNSVTVKSSDQVSLGEVQSLMGAFSAAKGDQEGKSAQPDPAAELEERLGGLMQQAVARLLTQIGGGAAGGARTGAARTPAVR